jgi:3-phosphoshikimate 1-carboxyvinyltransferase
MVAAVAPGPSRLEGLDTLPGKESDRLACLVDNLRRLGGVARAGDDWLEIDPAPLHGGEIDPRGDHRIAMAFAVLGLRVPGIIVRDPRCVRKSWPSFWSVVEEMEPGPG